MDSETLFKYISGQLPKEERRKVFEWISSSEENRSQYLATRRLYDIGLWSGFEVEEKKTRFGSALYYVAAACAAIVVMAGALFIYGSHTKPETAPFYLRAITAPPGKEVKIELADGTLAWLNSNSTLTLLDSEDGAERQVNLIGEAYFKVAHDPKHPFVVKTSSLGIKVLGTEFNLRAYTDGSNWSASLKEGSIAILDTAGKEVLSIKPGTKAEYVNGSLVASSTDPDEYLWKDGIIYFDNLTIRDILDRLATSFDLSICIDTENASLGHRYTGKFRTVDGYEHILKVLKLDRKFNYSIEKTTDERIEIHIR